MAYLIKTHEKSGLQVCSNGSVFIPASRRYKDHWTFGSLSRKYRLITYKGKNYSVHRLVAETFLENPNNYPTVDHIDRNPSNNDVSNKKYSSKFRRLKFNDGKIHYVPLEKAKEFENLKPYQRIYTK